MLAGDFFGEKKVARHPIRERAEWRARDLNEWAECSPRGHLQYYARPAEELERDA